jgi:protoporphyrinogen oxidase
MSIIPNTRNSNEAFIKEVVTYAKMVNPEFSEEWILAKTAYRYQYAQPVCTPGFLEMLHTFVQILRDYTL